jgi:ubiquinone/menaquinone biosynthesis C-methylase UbiE
VKAVEEQKRRAIEQHSRQAAEFAHRYARLDEDPYGSCFAYSRHRLRAALDRYLPSDGRGLRVLDVGCGTGHQSMELRRRGFEVAGIDASEEMLAESRARNPDLLVVRADVEAIPFRSSSFDFVLCIEVLRYLPRASACLREMARVLKPGGVCLATATPVFNLNGYWLVNRLVSAVPIPGLVRLRQYFFRSAELRREVLQAGFGAPEIRGVYFGPVNWLEHVAPRAVPRTLRRWERTDAALADRPRLRDFSNMFLLRARR